MTSAKRLLLLVTQAHWGGVQQFLVHFAEDLQREGHTVLLAAGGDGELFEEARKRGVPTRRLASMKRDIDLLTDLNAIEELERLYREFKPDAIHLNSSKMGVLGSLAARDFRLSTFDSRLRIVYRIGGWSFLEPIPGWKRWMYRVAERWSAKNKDVIITVHPGDEELARKLKIIPREKLVTVPNGLDVGAFVAQLKPRADARRALGLPDHAFVIGTVANAYPTKALLPYLDVLKRVLDEDRNAIAVIIGDGPEFEALRRKRDALGLRDRVILAGQLRDAATLCSAFDLFVLPSKKEGMPWTLLEAMASGIPSVATDVGACRWMLRDTKDGDAGAVVPANDAIALHDAIRELKNDPSRRERLGEAARRIVQNRFSWDATYRGNREALLPRS